jgi:hypothetical protein
MNSKVHPVKKTVLEEPEELNLDLRQEEGFTVTYANHVALVQTGFDIKVTFGRIDPSVGPNVVLQHNAIVLPWPAVKTLLYLLQVSLLAYEETNGHVPYPKGGMAPPPRVVPEDYAKAFPRAKQIHENVLKVWDDFLAANPETRPEK